MPNYRSMTHLGLYIEFWCFENDIIIIKDEVLSFSWILLFLDVKLSHVNESCMMSHLNLSWADDMLILIDLKF